MKKTRFTETQIIAAIKRQEAGAKISDLSRELGISEATVPQRHSIIGKQSMAVWMLTLGVRPVKKAQRSGSRKQ